MLKSAILFVALGAAFAQDPATAGGENRYFKTPNGREWEIPKVLKPKPHLITATADDVTEDRPIACPQGSPNCYRPPRHDPCRRRRLLGDNFEGRFDIPGHPCLQPGPNAGPILRPGGAFAAMFPSVYGLPHYPFSPDVQDWTRPAVVSPRDEGEVSAAEGQREDREELKISHNSGD
mmetsp:Transcript_35551/g.69741  ORF Transcript_35551/g.69741 Transcript_35551/m.69741 type:complete len:177 (+) Transcript_35551:448-978(+)|eukprot:CAMPEP_0175164600 /NCGR_PEP_ID=MMETSP0087-20121206/26518_1 /TAXON_ID=136419 /ORGANISM="Unknown Unknown, Strain D1" /LENGTH=176 /DNA_ID=CAMNT_0016453679 /DNA_START=360 /DNA_END=890 /DNA_ORIENTATION=-